jgi:phenylpropionate dioxygenase-like ring-hydroxylating dioxygenase large terminal subunit
MFLRNYWYVAASAPEIGRKPLRRIIMNEPVVFYRTEDGTPIALEDRCPHRRLPLSMGRLVENDVLQCHYHGLRFDRTGACVRVPGQYVIPASARIKTYPVVDRYKWLWIWMGDPALADPATIPDYHWFDDPNWGAKSDYLYAQCNWQYINDNLLDLTHLAFVHETTIGNMALVEHAAVRVQRTPHGVQVTRWIIDQPAPPAFVKIGGFTGNVDRWQIIDYMPPSYIRLDVGATPTGTGAPEGRRVGGIQMRNLNAMTPETETTTHYFWGQAHDFQPQNADMTERVFQQIKTAFLEDVSVFTNQQQNINLDPGAPTVDINADSGGIQARRIVDRLYAEEQATLNAAKTAAE